MAEKVLELAAKQRGKWRLEHCTAAGEPLNAPVINAWRKATGLTISDGYGQTETVLLVANVPHLGVPVVEGSMGVPLPGAYVAMVDEAGNEMKVDEEGDIAVRVDKSVEAGWGDSMVFRGYEREGGKLDRRLRQGSKGEEWYISGDRGKMDKDGRIWFVGRDDDGRWS